MEQAHMRTELDHLPLRKRRQLERAVAILLEEFDEALKGKLSEKRKRGRILKIILFGSHARGDWVEDRGSGYFSDYDLLVVVNGEDFTDPDHWYAAEERLNREFGATPLTLIVHSLSDVNDRFARGLPFFMDIARDGILLHEVPGHPLAAPRPLTPEDVRAEARKHFEQRFSGAGRFFALAKDAMAKSYEKETAFLLHQSTEQLYHCLLLTLALYSPKQHNIEKLRGQAEGLDARLIPVWPRKTRADRRAFSRLKRAYVDARYSPHYEITKDELDWLVQRIGALQALVETICKERLAG